MRGTGRSRGRASRRRRITPARAGNRGSSSSAVACLWDHPRACGEQVRCLRCPGCRHGITPARAGNRPATTPNSWRRRDHPRACGEQTAGQKVAALVVGSPPRVRGTVVQDQLVRAVCGITPARAGNSTSSTVRPERGRDHPRACGEQPCSSRRSVRGRGSPPRVRGTAGCRTCRAAAAGDHPRACGEQGPERATKPSASGSPPRVRGTVLPYLPRNAITGITPARAGNRPSKTRNSRKNGDHPRACGEQLVSGDMSGGVTGSPPRVRGTESALGARRQPMRITPARAGNRSRRIRT